MPNEQQIKDDKDWKEKLMIFKFNREKENKYRLTHEDYEEFISSTIKQTREKRDKELIEKIKLTPKTLLEDTSNENTYEEGYEQCLEDIINFIKSK